MSLIPKEIKAELDEVHGISAPVSATVDNWVNNFKCDQQKMNTVPDVQWN